MLSKLNLIFNKSNKFISYPKNLSIYVWIRAFRLIYKNSNYYSTKFTNQFSRIIGKGSSLSYASGRMAFYHILMHLKLSSNDEVVLQAPNCAVMYNAVIRIGAIPVAADVDYDCVGSDLTYIKKCITKNTKVVVVQHTLGIPCNIKEIVNFCRENEIILIEDCALTVSSTFDNIIVGNFGDYAIFSFDNTKPINAIIGGIVYSNDDNNIACLKLEQSKMPELSRSFRFFILFNAFLNYLFANNFNWFYNITYILTLKLVKFFKFKYSFPFLFNDSDYFVSTSELTYPYPAKMSECFSLLGLVGLENWNKTIIRRKANKDRLLHVVDKFKIGIVPRSYMASNLEIVPLRFIIFIPTTSIFFKLFDNIYNRNLMWFISPLACNDHFYKFGINDVMIPNCIDLNNKIFNLPIDSNDEVDRLIKKIESFYE